MHNLNDAKQKIIEHQRQCTPPPTPPPPPPLSNIKRHSPLKHQTESGLIFCEYLTPIKSA